LRRMRLESAGCAAVVLSKMHLARSGRREVLKVIECMDPGFIYRKVPRISARAGIARTSEIMRVVRRG
jgi:hypothetical protein